MVWWCGRRGVRVPVGVLRGRRRAAARAAGLVRRRVPVRGAEQPGALLAAHAGAQGAGLQLVSTPCLPVLRDGSLDGALHGDVP